MPHCSMHACCTSPLTLPIYDECVCPIKYITECFPCTCLIAPHLSWHTSLISASHSSYIIHQCASPRTPHASHVHRARASSHRTWHGTPHCSLLHGLVSCLPWPWLQQLQSSGHFKVGEIKSELQEHRRNAMGRRKAVYCV